MKIDAKIAQKVLDVVSHGLVTGMGIPTPGRMCVEAAVCYAMGLPHSDRPTCVSDAVREFKIQINDSHWSSSAARAAGLRRIAVAQLGSAEPTFNQGIFARTLAHSVVRFFLPIAIRNATNINPMCREALEAIAKECENAPELTSDDNVLNVEKLVRRVYSALYGSTTSGGGYISSSAMSASSSAIDAVQDVLSDLEQSAEYSAIAITYVSDTAPLGPKRDAILALAAELGVQALIKAGSPGCEFLSLCPVEVTK